MARKLIDVQDLGETHVSVVHDDEHGALAVGLSGGEPFAVSNRCRHLLGSLGDGKVTDDGCLQCPLHGARYDVHTGLMVRGPGGVFRPLGGVVKGTTGRLALATHPVELRDGAIWLA
jgi:3-phenylpropionate/trans-cinnamate dioxygenase ferredoxin subunit